MRLIFAASLMAFVLMAVGLPARADGSNPASMVLSDAQMDGVSAGGYVFTWPGYTLPPLQPLPTFGYCFGCTPIGAIVIENIISFPGYVPPSGP